MPATQTCSFLWYELMSSDGAAAVEFYRRVVGWDTKDSGMPGAGYTILSVGASPIGGVMQLTPEMTAAGARACWIGYIAVDDVDAYAARVAAAGGKILRPPGDVPGMIRFSVVADPYGAAFILFRGMSEQGPVALAPGTPGGIGWHELYAGDGAGAWDFYSGLFGWTKAEAVDMGSSGIYQTFAAGSAAMGGMMTRPPQVPAPMWLYYFNVDAIDAAVARATAAGGKLLMGPHEVPGGGWVAQLLDPQGVMFAMFAAKR